MSDSAAKSTENADPFMKLKAVLVFNGDMRDDLTSLLLMVLKTLNAESTINMYLLKVTLVEHRIYKEIY